MSDPRLASQRYQDSRSDPPPCERCQGTGEVFTSESPLPCPFCGSEGKLFTRKVHDLPESPHRLYWFVCSCYNCGVGVTHGEWDEKTALDKWNRRVPIRESSTPTRTCPDCAGLGVKNGKVKTKA